jgi:hypothetical protein
MRVSFYPTSGNFPRSYFGSSVYLRFPDRRVISNGSPLAFMDGFEMGIRALARLLGRV